MKENTLDINKQEFETPPITDIFCTTIHLSTQLAELSTRNELLSALTTIKSTLTKWANIGVKVINRVDYAFGVDKINSSFVEVLKSKNMSQFNVKLTAGITSGWIWLIESSLADTEPQSHVNGVESEIESEPSTHLTASHLTLYSISDRCRHM